VLLVLLCFIIGGLVWIAVDWSTRGAPAGTFMAKPYLQLGTNAGLAILWQTTPSLDQWTIEIKKDSQWKSGPPVIKRQLEIDSIKPFDLFSVDVTELGVKPFEYRILRNRRVEFSASTKERLSSSSRYKFAVLGDCGANTLAQRKIAYQIYMEHPNFVLVTGDIVYPDGRASEYLEHFFPIYNNDQAAPDAGAPLMRSTLMAAVPGNHDVGKAALFDVRNMEVFPDSLAYFYEWSQPLNGPGKYGQPNTPLLLHNPARQERFRVAAGKNYPTMSTFYFDNGNARYIMLDADHYMDWTNQVWRKWLDDALLAAKDKKWRFVLYHQTAFNSDTSHYSEQRMRLITDILEKHDVRIVFCGHVHNYQRTYPLHFIPSAMDAKGMVPGQIELAGKGIPTHAGEIVYVTTGAGGASLTGTQIAPLPEKWQPFTQKFIASTHSFSICEVAGDTLTVKQISEDGAVLDQFAVSAAPYAIPMPKPVQKPAQKSARN
jgi:hypothetical protein